MTEFDENILWEGKIKIVSGKGDVGSYLRLVDEDFDVDELAVALKKAKHEFGENLTNSIHASLIGVLEMLKFEIMLLKW